MSKLIYHWPAIVGTILGLAFSGYFFIYAPMMENVRERGYPFLTCEEQSNE